MNPVRLCVHQAADTIGGNCIEIVAPSGERILLDAGRPLDIPDDAPPPVPPSLDTDSSVLGILLSHAHTDHCGLLAVLPSTWPVYCGEATETLLHLFAALRKEEVTQSCRNWLNGQSFTIGPFVITPYLVDHSAFDAYAIQVEVGDQKILYTGDFRAHGRKSALTENLIRNPPKGIDVLIMEGTNLARSGNQIKDTLTEMEIEEHFIRLFKATKGRVFVSWSSTNIDRTVTLYRACKKTDRILVPDLFCMLVLSRLSRFANIPQPEWKSNQMRTAVTSRMIYLTERLGTPNFVNYLKECRTAMSAKALCESPEKWVVMSRDSLVDDFSRKGVVPNHDDAWVWSLWKGYLEQDSARKMQQFFAPCYRECIHTSGHATPDALLRFARAMQPKMIIPVHGDAWVEHSGLLSNLYFATNEEWVDLDDFALPHAN